MCYSVILMDSYLEPPDIDTCRCTGIKKELGYCECFLADELEDKEDEEELLNVA